MLFVMKNANQHTYHGKKGVHFTHQLSHNILHWRRQLIYIFLIILALQSNQIIALISRSTHPNNIDYIKMRKYETTQVSKKTFLPRARMFLLYVTKTHYSHPK